MAKKTIKKKASSAGMSTRERMLKRKEDLAKKGNGGGFNFIKEGTTRIRIKSPGEDQELGMEIIQFYLGKDLGSIISPATFDESCPLMDTYKKLKDSSKESDKALASELVPKRRYIIGGIGYKDEKGKEIDPDKVDKAWMITGSVYQDIIDLYLDEDEWGDMTDEEDGYDVKINRTGSGKNDTSYSVSPCQRKALSSKYHGTIDLESIVRGQMKSYDELEEILEKFCSIKADDLDDEDDSPKKSKKVKNKKKRNGDI